MFITNLIYVCFICIINVWIIIISIFCMSLFVFIINVNLKKQIEMYVITMMNFFSSCYTLYILSSSRLDHRTPRTSLSISFLSAWQSRYPQGWKSESCSHLLEFSSNWLFHSSWVIHFYWKSHKHSFRPFPNCSITKYFWLCHGL